MGKREYLLKEATKQRRWLSVLLFGFLFVVVAAGVVYKVVNVINKPPKIPSYYQLSSNFTKDDLILAFKEIREDSEYKFYFSALNRGQASEVLAKTTLQLFENRDPKELLKVIKDTKMEVEAAGRLFYFLDYSPEFYRNPSQFTELEEVLNQFIVKEFELTLLGGFYKGTYDPIFSFEWDHTSQLAAFKLKQVVAEVKKERVKK